MTFPKLSRKIFRTRSVISMGLSAPDLSRFLQISLHSFHGHWKYILTWLCRRQQRKKWSWEQWKPFSSWSGQSIHQFQSGIHWCLKKLIIICKIRNKQRHKAQWGTLKAEPKLIPQEDRGINKYCLKEKLYQMFKEKLWKMTVGFFGLKGVGGVVYIKEN